MTKQQTISIYSSSRLGWGRVSILSTTTLWSEEQMEPIIENGSSLTTSTRKEYCRNHYDAQVYKFRTSHRNVFTILLVDLFRKS